MFEDIYPTQSTVGWTPAHWFVCFMLAFIAACLLMAAIAGSRVTFAEAVSDRPGSDDSAEFFIAAVVSALIAAFAAWWSWNRLTALFDQASAASAFFIWIIITGLAASAFAVGSEVAGIRASRALWAACVGLMAIIGLGALIVSMFNKAAAALGVGAGGLALLVMIVAGIALTPG